MLARSALSFARNASRSGRILSSLARISTARARSFVASSIYGYSFNSGLNFIEIYIFRIIQNNHNINMTYISFFDIFY